MNAHESLTQSLFQGMLTVPERDYTIKPWDEARNVGAGKSTRFEPTGNRQFDRLVVALKPSLRYGEEGPPAYDYLSDAITIPHRDSFASPDEYLSTFAHELSHWTMRRTGREPHMGDPVRYAREEMTADISCAILLAECGIDPALNDRADYVRGWLIGSMEAQQERMDAFTQMVGIPAMKYGREEIDREYTEAVARAERAAGFILSAGSPAETN